MLQYELWVFYEFCSNTNNLIIDYLKWDYIIQLENLIDNDPNLCVSLTDQHVHQPLKSNEERTFSERMEQ
jgi:hypothetical protein